MTFLRSADNLRVGEGGLLPRLRSWWSAEAVVVRACDQQDVVTYFVRPSVSAVRSLRVPCCESGRVMDTTMNEVSSCNCIEDTPAACTTVNPRENVTPSSAAEICIVLGLASNASDDVARGARRGHRGESDELEWRKCGVSAKIAVECSVGRQLAGDVAQRVAPRWRVVARKSTRSPRVAYVAVAFGEPMEERLRRVVFVLHAASWNGNSSLVVLVVPSRDWMAPARAQMGSMGVVVVADFVRPAVSCAYAAKSNAASAWTVGLDIVVATFLLASFDAIAYVESDMLFLESPQRQLELFAISDADFEAAPDEFLPNFNAGVFFARPSRHFYGYLADFRLHDVSNAQPSALCLFGVQDLLNAAVPQYFGPSRVSLRDEVEFNCQYGCAGRTRRARLVHFNGPEKPWLPLENFTRPTAEFLSHVREYVARYAAWLNSSRT